MENSISFQVEFGENNKEQQLTLGGSLIRRGNFNVLVKLTARTDNSALNKGGDSATIDASAMAPRRQTTAPHIDNAVLTGMAWRQAVLSTH